MPLADIFILAIVFYLAYRFVFHFLLPVMKAGRQMREQFRNMQGGMGQQEEARQASSGSGPAGFSGSRPGERHSSPKGRAEDYIDFEEVKSPK